MVPNPDLERGHLVGNWPEGQHTAINSLCMLHNMLLLDALMVGLGKDQVHKIAGCSSVY